jgi:hypothetical protein
MTLLFTATFLDAAPRIGLGIAAVLSLAPGIVSTLRGGVIIRIMRTAGVENCFDLRNSSGGAAPWITESP